jgi:hypothetical protein
MDNGLLLDINSIFFLSKLTHEGEASLSELVQQYQYLKGLKISKLFTEKSFFLKKFLS